jgi:hypothetical protein
MPQERRAPTPRSHSAIFGIALGVYLVWTAATYLLEGRIGLLISGDPSGRLVYALVANLLLGTVLVLFILSSFRRDREIPDEVYGFQSLRRTVISVIGAFALGAVIFILSSPKTLDPVVILNLFAQAINTSTAEVLVIYLLVGATVVWLLESRGRGISLLAGIMIAAVLFGVYHIAHSPPFNTAPVIMMLTLVGVVTAVFFLVVREVYATIVFHNFLALFGVIQNIDVANFQHPNLFLLGVLLVTLAVLIGLDLSLIRKRPPAPVA